MSESEDHPSRETLDTIDVDGHRYPIEIDHAARRFEIRIGEHVAVLPFHIVRSTLSLIHTEVPVALRHKGLADAIAHAALEYARSHSLLVKPYCPFVAAYLRRHPDYRVLVDPEFPLSDANAPTDS
jgi:predicted GNAT family acetyltransferase